MSVMASQITSLAIVYSTVYPGADQRKHQSSALLAFVTGEFPAEMASNTENVSSWWRHHEGMAFSKRFTTFKFLQDMEILMWPGYKISTALQDDIRITWDWYYAL